MITQVIDLILLEYPNLLVEMNTLKNIKNTKYGFNYCRCFYYLEFPNMISNPFENFVENYKKYRYKEITRAWLHGFRNPVNYFPMEHHSY